MPHTLAALVDRLTAGTIAVDLQGHNRRRGMTDEQTTACDREIVEWDLTGLRMDLDREAEAVARHGAQWQGRLIAPGERLREWTSGDLTCRTCGARLVSVLRDDDTIAYATFRQGIVRWTPEHRMVRETPDLADDVPCPHAAGAAPHRTVIDVPTGALVFANFFRGIADAPEGQTYTAPFDVSTLRGRRGIADHLAPQGVGYGQMGNMLIGIAVPAGNAPARTVRLLTRDPVELQDDWAVREAHGEDPSADPYAYASPGNRAFVARHLGEGYQDAGSLSLAMWRWMCADAATIARLGLEPGEPDDVVQVAVMPGRWEITHFYDSSADDNILASELRWLGPSAESAR